MKNVCLFAVIILPIFLSAQTQLPERQADFTAAPESDGSMRFKAICPPLAQIPGAPPAFYTYYWEFGDGDFSFEESPVHRYAEEGTKMAALWATQCYDDTKPPPRGQQKAVYTSIAKDLEKTAADVFTSRNEAVAMKTNRQPKAEEEIVCVLSYRNRSTYTTDGRLHLFFNEKKFPASHFQFQNARLHFGETDESAISAVTPPAFIDWTLLGEGWSATGDAAISPVVPYQPPAGVSELLEEARKTYREKHSWRFTALKPGEKRNLFVTLQGTASMLKDTSAFIHLQAILEPFDPAIPAEEFTLEIEIVSSHDPNLIAVSDNRVNYRRLAGEKLDYKVRFQNNGEGPAKKIELTITVPEGLNHTKMRPLDWYPKCPICPKTPAAGGCLDTATTQDKLIFTFRDIYLPGSRQKGLSDYDSTQGFVRYRIDPDKDMPKRAFRSQASIVFDKNKPVYTNFSRTRFKPGLSPGLKAGYGFQPDSSKSGYFFIGASLSPYKSWKVYPQIEVLTGLKGRTEFADPVQSVYYPIDSFGMTDIYVDSLVTVSKKGSRGFISLEIPVLLRKNFTRFFGAGIGGAATVVFQDEDIEQVTTTTARRYFKVDGPGGVVVFEASDPKVTSRSTASSSRDTDLRWALFADLTLGSVRAGPNVGIRAGGFFSDGVQPFVQVSLELKL